MEAYNNVIHQIISLKIPPLLKWRTLEYFLYWYFYHKECEHDDIDILSLIMCLDSLTPEEQNASIHAAAAYWIASNETDSLIEMDNFLLNHQNKYQEHKKNKSKRIAYEVHKAFQRVVDCMIPLAVKSVAYWRPLDMFLNRHPQFDLFYLFDLMKKEKNARQKPFILSLLCLQYMYGSYKLL